MNAAKKGRPRKLAGFDLGRELAALGYRQLDGIHVLPVGGGMVSCVDASSSQGWLAAPDGRTTGHWKSATPDRWALNMARTAATAAR